MKKPTKADLLSAANLLTYLRILLIPVFCFLFLRNSSGKDYYISVCLVMLICLTDCFDGYVARKFNDVTEIGTLLDPVADKLAQAAVAVCLATRYPLMWALCGLLILKEGFMAVMGLINLRRGKKLDSAKWFGKVCSAVLFAVLVVILLFPTLPLQAVNGLILGAMAVMLVTLILYIPVFVKMLREH